MTPHVVLLADAGPGIGWGHAVRQLALAEALVAKRVRTLFVTRTREALRLDWPCPVQVGEVDLAAVRVAVYDLPQPAATWPTALLSPTHVVVFDDYGTVQWPNGASVVDPHFGAAARMGGLDGARFLGPRWAPLRRPFNWTGARTPYWYGGVHGTPPLRYEAGTGGLGTAHQVASAMVEAPYAIVPPSMIALECLCVGVPVVLTVPGEKWQPIADAMIAAGVAQPDTPEGIEAATDPTTAKRTSEAGMEAVDGHGAERLAEWLAE